jgi:radical SAM superfamily enzyme YgiQ (UPF0313 family)
MRVLLVNPPCGARTIGMRHISRIEPLALETIGAAVKEGNEVQLVDMLAYPGDLLATLKHFKPDVVGVTTEAARSGQAKNVLRTIRRLVPDCLTVVGGHHPTLFPDDFEDPAVDLVVHGEGVEAFAEICAARKAGATTFEHIAGLTIRTKVGLKSTDPRPIPTTLDHHPFPDRSLTARYRKHYYYITEPSAAGMRLSMGCEHSCTFCPNPLYAQNCFATRDPRKMFEEICSIQEPFIYFCDNGTFHEVDRMRTLGQMLLDAGIKKRYLTYVRADTIVNNPDLFELWAQAGLSIAMIGLEALDDTELDGFQKGIHMSQNEGAVRFLEEIGVGISAGFLVKPTFTRQDFTQLNRYIRTHPSIMHAEFTPITPFPGTKYYEQQKQNVLTTDWEVYDMQHFVTRTPIPTKKLYGMMLGSYRKIVHRVIRQERLYWPHRGFRPDKLRVLGGLIANSLSLRSAHRHVPSAPVDAEHQIINERGTACVNGPAATPKPSAVMLSADNADSRR